MMLSVMFAASSCTEDEPVTPPVPPAGDPEIAFTQDRLEIPIEGGDMSAAFTLSNPVEDIEPSAACEADWITGIVVDTADAQVNFTAAENDGYEEKRAELILTYGNLSDTLILVQEAAVKSFDINVTDSTVSSFAYEVIPVDESMTYFTQVVEKEYFDSFGSSDEFIAADIDLLKLYASENGMTFEECLQQMLKKGMFSRELVRQLSGKQFVIYAFGLDYTGASLTGLNSREVSTVQVEQSDITFEIEVSQDGKTTTAKIVPSDSEQYYIAGIVDANEYYNMPGGYILGYMQSTIWDNVDMLEQMQMPDPYSLTLNMVAEKGTCTIDQELTAGTDYVAYAVSISDECIINSEPEILEFRTDDVVMSDNVISIEIVNVETRLIDVEVKTTNDDPYVMLALEASPYKGLTDEEILESINAHYNFMRVCRGDTTLRFSYPDSEYQPNTEYIVFAFGYDLGVPTTDIVYQYITTTDAKQSDMTFNLLYNGYYAGAEVQEAYPDNFTADISGHAIFHVKANSVPRERLYYKYYTVKTGDWTDRQKYTDDEAMAELIELGKTTIGVSWDYNMIMLKYDMDFTFIGFAIDVAGNPTAVWRQLVHPTEDGTVPMGDFNPNDLWNNWGDEASSSAVSIAGGDGWMMPLIAR